MFESIIQWIQELLSNHIPILDTLKIPELLSYMFYGTEVGLALLVVIVWMYFATYELNPNNEIEKYQIRGNTV
jgi:hypothetical protein